MNKLFSRYYLLFYGIACVHLIAIVFNWNNAIAFTKPLLLISLTYSAYLLYGSDRLHKGFLFYVLLAALLFSCLGDTALLLEKKLAIPLLFFLGLGSFLISHILYSVLFIKLSKLTIKLYWLIPYILYFVFLLKYLLDGMEPSLKLPVTIYGSAITFMAWNSWRCYKSNNFLGFWIVIGSLFFIISDSVLAINRFKSAILFEDIIIMSTYILAQYLISFGVVSILKSEQHKY